MLPGVTTELGPRRVALICKRLATVQSSESLSRRECRQRSSVRLFGLRVACACAGAVGTPPSHMRMIAIEAEPIRRPRDPALGLLASPRKCKQRTAQGKERDARTSIMAWNSPRGSRIGGGVLVPNARSMYGVRRGDKLIGKTCLWHPSRLHLARLRCVPCVVRIVCSEYQRSGLPADCAQQGAHVLTLPLVSHPSNSGGFPAHNHLMGLLRCPGSL